MSAIYGARRYAEIFDIIVDSRLIIDQVAAELRFNDVSKSF
jgi:hypothetical protein